MARIATLGPEGSFSEEAAIEYGRTLGEAVEIVFLDKPEDILSLGRDAHYGLVAIENSLEGSIGHTLDLLREMEYPICDEIVLRIRHFLLGRATSRPIRRIYSHPAALGQCRRFIREGLGDAELVATSSTAEGARRALVEAGCAAIGSLRAAEIYGLEVLAGDIQDEDSYTRFIIVGRDPHGPTGCDKTSVIFTVKDIPGALHRALEPFARRKLNLNKIESRPSRRALGEYVFFLDFQGHRSETGSAEALTELADLCTSIKVLGSYPAASAPTRQGT